MTQEEKELLLKDLCARLPYGVKIHTWYGEIITSDMNTFSVSYDEIDIEQLAGMKPYLRPMSSMTDEERNEAIQFEINNLGPIGFNWNLIVSNSSELIEWLNKKQFDYRGLIPMGLALEAPEGMYNAKTE